VVAVLSSTEKVVGSGWTGRLGIILLGFFSLLVLGLMLPKVSRGPSEKEIQANASGTTQSSAACRSPNSAPLPVTRSWIRIGPPSHQLKIGPFVN
jgi:hypothetical protein